MRRTMYLIFFSNGARHAHYSGFVPTGDAGSKGKIIHVTGNPATGFFLEFKRNYDLQDEDRKYQMVSLAQVNDQYISDTTKDGNPSTDTTAHDRIESVAIVVSPPGPSCNPFDPSARNCQDWMRDYVQKLVEEGHVESTALEMVQNAPRVFRPDARVTND